MMTASHINPLITSEPIRINSPVIYVSILIKPNHKNLKYPPFK